MAGGFPVPRRSGPAPGRPGLLPDLEALALLVSVGEVGSISAAAARHGVTQPAASMRLRRLERLLGLQLLERSAAGARPTPAGSAVLAWSSAVLEAVDSLVAGTAALRAGERSQLRLASSLTAAEYLLPRWLQALATAEAGVRVSLEMHNSAQVCELVERGEVELGFIEGATPPPRLRSRAVARDELVVVVAPGHPWARRRRALGAAELARTPLVLRERGSGTREVLSAALEAIGLEPTVLMELGSTTAIKAAVATGVGPSVISALAVAAESRAGQLRVVECDGVVLTRTIRAVWPTAHELTPPASRLVGIAAVATGIGVAVPTNERPAS